ncbi:MAG: esterase/lipase family protein [Intestinimonas sp.]
MKIMMGGYELFMTSAWLSVAILGLYLVYLPHIISTTGVSAPRALWSIALTLLLLFLLLANGFFRIVFTSTRLRLALRVLLICLWWCPVVNFFLLWRACALVKAEYRFDLAKQECNALRKENEVCATRYPILLVHGIFFRDWQLINYWGRIPKELTRNGAVLYYGEQQSSAAVAESAAELRDQIQKIIAETGCGKVNIIAHSKGGLDSRYAISHLGMDRYVASSPPSIPRIGAVSLPRN